MDLEGIDVIELSDQLKALIVEVLATGLSEGYVSLIPPTFGECIKANAPRLQLLHRRTSGRIHDLYRIDIYAVSAPPVQMWNGREGFDIDMLMKCR